MTVLFLFNKWVNWGWAQLSNLLQVVLTEDDEVGTPVVYCINIVTPGSSSHGSQSQGEMPPFKFSVYAVKTTYQYPVTLLFI